MKTETIERILKQHSIPYYIENDRLDARSAPRLAGVLIQNKSPCREGRGD